MRFTTLAIFSAVAVFLLYAVLIGSLFAFVRGDQLLATLNSPRTLFAIKTSLAAATLAAGFSLLVGVPAAYALSRSVFPLRGLVDLILELPMIVSPAALGAMILMFFHTPAGQWLSEMGISVVFAFSGIVCAQFVTTAGITVRLIKAVFDEIPPRYEQVARSLGAPPFAAFRTVTLPLAARGIFASAVLTWAKALGEFGATVMVAGTMAMRTETVPVAIFLRLGNADIKGAVVMILILVAVGLAVLALARVIARKNAHA